MHVNRGSSITIVKAFPIRIETNKKGINQTRFLHPSASGAVTTILNSTSYSLSSLIMACQCCSHSYVMMLRSGPASVDAHLYIEAAQTAANVRLARLLGHALTRRSLYVPISSLLINFAYARDHNKEDSKVEDCSWPNCSCGSDVKGACAVRK